jgi:uncharacterized membrane protein
LQAHESKSSFQARMLLIYLIISFFITAYILYLAVLNASIYELIFTIANLLVNGIVVKSSYTFYKYLKGMRNEI